MRYALLVYDASAHEHGRHGDYHAVAASPAVIAHYRFRSARTAITVRVADDRIVENEGPVGDTTRDLRAVYVLDGVDRRPAVELAARLPAARSGGVVEVWPIGDPPLRR